MILLPVVTSTHTIRRCCNMLIWFNFIIKQPVPAQFTLPESSVFDIIAPIKWANSLGACFVSQDMTLVKRSSAPFKPSVNRGWWMGHQDCAHLYQETHPSPRDRLLHWRQMLISTIASRLRSTLYPGYFPPYHHGMAKHSGKLFLVNFSHKSFDIPLWSRACAFNAKRAQHISA